MAYPNLAIIRRKKYHRSFWVDWKTVATCSHLLFTLLCFGFHLGPFWFDVRRVMVTFWTVRMSGTSWYCLSNSACQALIFTLEHCFRCQWHEGFSWKTDGWWNLGMKWAVCGVGLWFWKQKCNALYRLLQYRMSCRRRGA